MPCSVVNTVDELEDDPQVAARKMIVDIEYPGLGRIPIPGMPVKLSLTPGEIRSRAPEIGEHNEEIYCNLLGFSTEELRRLKKGGVI